MTTSQLTSRVQTTIPQPVRAALHSGEGDEIAYSIEVNRVMLPTCDRPTKAAANPFCAFSEWDGSADTDTYARL